MNPEKPQASRWCGWIGLGMCLAAGIGLPACHGISGDTGGGNTVPEESSGSSNGNPEVAAAGYRVERVNKREDPTIGPLTFFLWDVRVQRLDGDARVLRWPVYHEPLVVGNRLFLFPARQHEMRQLVIHRLDRASFSIMNLPRDCDPYFGRPSVSPCGTMLAHYALAEDDRAARIRIRRIAWNWPLLAESGWIETNATDVPPIPPRWQGNRQVTGDIGFFYQASDGDLTIEIVHRP